MEEETTPPTRARLNLLSSLRYRDSRIFWIGTGIASIAQAAFLVSSGWLAFQLRGSGAAGLVTFATMVPFLIATPIGGLLADRIDRRTLVLCTQVTQCVVALTLGVQTIFGTITFPQLVALVFLSGMARTVELPTVATMLPGLVPRAEILNIFSLNSLATLGSRFVGPGLVAPILAARGAGAAYLLIAALYVPAFLLVLRVPRVVRTLGARMTLRGQISEGGRYIFGRGVLALLLGVIVLHCSLTMAFDSILPLFAQQNLRGQGAIYSSLVAALGAGAIAGSLLIAGLRSRATRGALMFAGGIGSGIFTIVMALSNNWVMSIVTLFAVGACQTVFMTLANTMMQESVPDALRGRVTSLFLMSAGGIMSFGNLANGWLAGKFGTSPVLALPGIAFIALLLLLSATRPTLRRLYQDGMLPPDRREIAAPAMAGD